MKRLSIFLRFFDEHLFFLLRDFYFMWSHLLENLYFAQSSINIFRLATTVRDENEEVELLVIAIYEPIRFFKIWGKHPPHEIILVPDVHEIIPFIFLHLPHIAEMDPHHLHSLKYIDLTKPWVSRVIRLGKKYQYSLSFIINNRKVFFELPHKSRFLYEYDSHWKIAILIPEPRPWMMLQRLIDPEAYLRNINDLRISSTVLLEDCVIAHTVAINRKLSHVKFIGLQEPNDFIEKLIQLKIKKLFHWAFEKAKREIREQLFEGREQYLEIMDNVLYFGG